MPPFVPDLLSSLQSTILLLALREESAQVYFMHLFVPDVDILP